MWAACFATTITAAEQNSHSCGGVPFSTAATAIAAAASSSLLSDY